MNIVRISAVLLSSLLLFSCSRNGLSSGEGSGWLSLDLGKDPSAELVVKSMETVTDLSAWNLAVTSKATGEVIKVSDASTLQSEPLELKIGKYNVAASNAVEIPVAAWDAPVYAGSSDVTIKADQTTTAKITGTLANTMVTVTLDKSVTDYFSDCTVSFNNGLGENLVFSQSGSTMDKTAYFSVTGNLNWEASLFTEDGGKYVSGIQSYTDVKPKQHYHLTLRIIEESDPFGATSLKLLINDSYTEKTYDLKADADETVAKPVITADYDMDATLAMSQSSNPGKYITLTAEAGIKSVLFNHNDDLLANSGLPKWNYAWTSVQSAGTLDGFGVSVNLASSDAKSATLDMNDLLSRLDIGVYKFYLTLIDHYDRYAEQMLTVEIISPIDAEAVSARAWARFAILTAKWNTTLQPEGLSVQYRKVSDTEWITATNAFSYIEGTKRFTVEVYSLEPSTQYVFRAVSAKDEESVEVGFATEAAEIVPNLNFDSWVQDGKVWYPNASTDNLVWDSANPGTGNLAIGAVNPTTPEESILAVSGEGKKAAKLTSSTALGQFAAGNIYTGKFGKVAGLGAELYWGYRFTSRPIALRGYYRYDPKTIDKVKDPYKDLEGQEDTGSLKVYLTDWTTMFTLNTTDKLFLSDDDPSVIALGDHPMHSTGGQYVPVVIPIKYNSNSRIPTFITIAGAASRLGDYFTGAVGSTLYLDEFELIYDPAELTEEQRVEIGYR